MSSGVINFEKDNWKWSFLSYYSSPPCLPRARHTSLVFQGRAWFPLLGNSKSICSLQSPLCEVNYEEMGLRGAFAFKWLDLQWGRYKGSELNLLQAGEVCAPGQRKQGSVATEEVPSIGGNGSIREESLPGREVLSNVFKVKEFLRRMYTQVT